MRHFEDKEFACRCGCGAGIEKMQPDLLVLLDAARQIADVPFKITSAVRCPVHNASVGGVPKSPHIGGWAVDIAVSDSRNRFVVMNALSCVGITRFGVAASYVHADIDPEKAPDVIWTYPYA